MISSDLGRSGGKHDGGVDCRRSQGPVPRDDYAWDWSGRRVRGLIEDSGAERFDGRSDVHRGEDARRNGALAWERRTELRTRGGLRGLQNAHGSTGAEFACKSASFQIGRSRRERPVLRQSSGTQKLR
jgi:hypothetical protein